MSDLVSIIIPVFNEEKYLNEAISSCINQTYSDIEIIAINDGSTDNSVEILKSYEDKIIVKSQENKGVSAATNSGISSMTGKFFKIMNANDILYPEAVELLVSEFIKINDKKTIIYGDGDIIDSKGNFIGEFLCTNLNHLSKFEQNVILLNHNFVSNITSLFHGDTFEEYGLYDESLKAAGDYELWLRLCLQFNFKLHMLEKKIVKMRVHKNKGITARALKETPNYRREVSNLVLRRLEPLTRQKYELALKEYKEKQKEEK